MKKIITIFMATIMLLSVVGCSSNKVERDSTPIKEAFMNLAQSK